MRRSTRFLVLSVLTASLAACGGSSAPVDAGSGANAPAATDAPAGSTDTAASAPAATDAGGGMDMGGGDPTADSDLAARIPSSVDGQAITVTSTDFSKLPAGLDAATMFAGGDTMTTWLKDNGKSWNDVSILSAMTDELIASSADTKTGLLTAIRVKGANPDGLFEWFTGSSNADAFEQTDKKTIGSRTVSYWGVQGITTGGMYVWSEGDTVYWLTNATPESFAEAFIAAIK